MNAKKLTSFLMAGFITGVNIFSMSVYATDYEPGTLNTDTEISSSKSFSIPITITKQAAETQNIGDPHGMSDTDDPNIPNIGKVFTYGDISTEPFNFKAELKSVTFTTSGGSANTTNRADAITAGRPLEVFDTDGTGTNDVYIDPINYYFGSSLSSYKTDFASDNSVSPDTIVNGNLWHTDANGNLYLPLDTTTKVAYNGVNMSYMEFLENFASGADYVTVKFDYYISEKIDSSRIDIMYTSATMPLSITFDLRSTTTTDSSGNIIDSGASITTEYAESYFKNVNLGGIENSTNLAFETGSDGTNTSSRVITVGTDTDGKSTFIPSAITGNTIPTAKGADGTTDVPSIAVTDAQGFSKVIADSSANETITKLLENANIADYNNTFKFKVYWQNSNDFNTGSRVELGEITNNNDVIHGFELVNSEMRTAFVNALKSGTMYKDFNIVIAEYVDTTTQFGNDSATDPKFVFDTGKEVGATLRLYLDSNGIVHTDMLSTVETSKPGYFYHNLVNPSTTVFGAERDSSYANYLNPSVISFTNKYVPSYSASDIIIEIGSDGTNKNEKKITTDSSGNIVSVTTPDTVDTHGTPTVSNPDTFRGTVVGKTIGESITKTLLRDNINNYSFNFDVNLVDNNFVKTTNSYLGSFSNTASNLHSYIKATSEIASEFTKYVNTNGAEGKNTFNILITERNTGYSNGVEYNIGNKSIGCTLELSLDSNDIVHTDVKDYFIHDNTKNVQFGAEKSETSSYYRPTSGIGFINIAYGDIHSSSGTLIAELGYDPSNTGYRVVVPNKDNPNSSTISNTTTTDNNNVPSVPSSNAYGKVILDNTGSNENVTKTFINGKINQATFKFNISSVRDDYTKVTDMSTVTNNAGSLHNLFTVPNSVLHDFAQSVHYDVNTSSFVGSKTFNLNVQEVIPQSSAGVKYNIGNKNVSFKLKLYIDNNGVVHADTYDYYIHNANGHNNFGEELNIAFNNEGDFGFTTADKFNEYYYPSTGLGFINSKNKYTVSNFSGISLNSANLKSSKVGSKANTTDASKVKEITLNLSKLNAFVAETLDFSRLELTTDSEGNDYVLEYGVDGVVLGLRRLLTTYKGGARRYGTGDFSNVGLLIGVLGTVITLLLVTIMAIVYVKKSTKKEIK